jgi:type I restriction enzyme S subunit
MTNWRNVEIGNVIDFNPSESIKKGSLAKKIPMDKLTVFEKKIKGFEVSEYKAGPKFKNGDTLVAKITPCLENGKTAQVDVLEENEVAFGSSEFIVLRETDSTINDFIFYLAKSPAFRKRAISCMEGTSGRKRVNEGALKLQVLPIPDKKTQKKIAKVLSDFDEKIELNNKIIVELEVMAKTLYDYWFVQFDFPDANGKPYKSSGGKMVYNKELKREIPLGWEVKTLLDIATFVNGLACQKFRPKENEESYRVIKIREMGTGFTDNSEFVSKNIPDKIVVYNGDILFSWSATLDVKIWTGGTGALNQHIFKITSNDFPKSYYYFELLNYLQHFKMQAELRKTTMGHITQDHLRQSRITVPPKDLINKLDKILNPILEKKVKLEEENQELASLRDWLLPMLMNGQVSVGEVEEKLGMVAEPIDEYKKS